MPIAQERMIAMVQEFLTYNEHTQKFITDLKQTAAFYHKGDLTQDEAMAGIIIAITNYQPPPFKRLYIEEAHFTKKAKYNEKKKRYVQGQKMTQQGLAQDNTWLAQAQSQGKPFTLPTETSSTPSSATSPYSLETTLQMQQDIERALAPPPIPRPAPPPASPRKSGDTVPDLSEYEAEPPDFQKGIF